MNAARLKGKVKEISISDLSKVEALAAVMTKDGEEDAMDTGKTILNAGASALKPEEKFALGVKEEGKRK